MKMISANILRIKDVHVSFSLFMVLEVPGLSLPSEQYKMQI